MANYHRPEIDGLRAIAVLSVIFFHFDILYFKGGFVGVDIFFVISGFLITSLIQSQIDQNIFSFKSFYLNRAKRLLPAFFFLLIVLLILGFFTFDFLTYKSFGKEIIASLFYFSNILFWKEIGYFDLDAIQKPLLHTWSLSIEEQYYFLFPVLIVLINKFFRVKRKVLFILIVLFIISFVANIYFIKSFKSATFYLLPTRAWEFFAGSTLVFVPKIKWHNWIKDLFFSIGLFSLIYSIITLSSDNYPGYYALIPVLGTTLLIYFGNNSNFYIVRLLKSNLFIFFGKISYSLYLWHWPILVFYKYIVMRKFENTDFLLCFTIILSMSFLSWKFVEQKFRYYTTRSNYKIALTFIFLSLFFSFFGFLINRKNGLPWRSDYNSKLIEVFSDPFWDKVSENEGKIFKLQDISPLQIGFKSNKMKFILWGDSHARAISFGLHEFGNKYKFGGYLFSFSATPPILETNNLNNTTFNIEKYNRSIMDFIVNNDSIQNIILCARWTYYIKDTFDVNEYTNRPIFFNSNIKKFDKKLKNKEHFFLGLTKTLDELMKANKKVFIVTPLPELTYDVRNFIGNSLTYSFFNIKLPQNMKGKEQYYKENYYFFEYFSKLAKHPNIHLLNLQEILYKNQSDVYESGNLIYRDKNHLSKFGSLFVNNLFVPVFK